MRKTWLAPLAAALIAAPAIAHHSFAMFDMKTNVTKTGTVTDFKWTNPHAWMHVDVDNEPFALEMTSPNNLVKTGWRRSSMKAGDKVTVEYHPLINGKKGGSLVQVTLANGTVLKNQ